MCFFAVVANAVRCLKFVRPWSYLAGRGWTRAQRDRHGPGANESVGPRGATNLRVQHLAHWHPGWSAECATSAVAWVVHAPTLITARHGAWARVLCRSRCPSVRRGECWIVMHVVCPPSRITDGIMWWSKLCHHLGHRSRVSLCGTECSHANHAPVRSKTPQPFSSRVVTSRGTSPARLDTKVKARNITTVVDQKNAIVSCS